MIKDTASKPRILSLDLMRLLSAMGVIMIHACANYLMAPAASAGFIAANILSSCARLSVNVFLMVSGALLLDENREITPKYILRSLLQLFFLLVFWAAVYAVVNEILYPQLTGRAISVRRVLKQLILGHYHLWYLYMLIGMYLILPILRKFVKLENKSTVLYFIFLAYLFHFSIPLVNRFFDSTVSTNGIIATYAHQFKLSFVGEYTAFFLLGWYIANSEFSRKLRLLIYGAGLLGLLTVILGTQFTRTPESNLIAFFHSNCNLPVAVATPAAFTAGYYLLRDKRCSSRHPVAVLSNLSFGVYASHLLFLVPVFALLYNLPPVPHILASFAITTVLTYGFTWLLSKIPILKKVVRG